MKINQRVYMYIIHITCITYILYKYLKFPRRCSVEKYLDLKNDNDYTKLKNAAKILQNGGLVLFPTETVYGIGADGLNEKAVQKIYEVKGRASDNPLILHISNIDMVNQITENITEVEYKLMNAFWPGPFTIILKKKKCVPDIVTGGLDTVAVRMPSNKIANKLIEYANTPIAAPSANISGRPSGTCIEDIYEELSSKMDYIINGGRCEVGVESTVVRVEDGTVRILRPGMISKEQIEQLVQSVILDKYLFENLKPEDEVLSPGMKYKHYAPKSKCMLVYSKNNEKMIHKIQEIEGKYTNVVIICSNENANKYKEATVLNYGSKERLEEVSFNIFTLLRKVDKLRPDIVLIEGVKEDGIGLAIMNRLIRACSHNYMII